MIQNGIYTIENAQTREHRTFKVHTVQRGDLKGKRIVSLLTGSDNDNDYQSFAFLNSNGVTVWGRFRGTKYESLGRMVWAAMSQILPGKYKVHHEGRCRRCNRTLTTPESIQAGIGPECANKEGA